VIDIMLLETVRMSVIGWASCHRIGCHHGRSLGDQIVSSMFDTTTDSGIPIASSSYLVMGGDRVLSWIDDCLELILFPLS
jgi:hypothetical protein